MRTLAAAAAAAAAAAVSLSALALRRYLAARDDLAKVAPDLRSPALVAITAPRNGRELRFSRMTASLRTPSGRGVSVAEHRANGVRVLVTTPSEGSRPLPGVLWIHSGGFVVGSPQFEGFLTGRLARELNAVVVSPDYRLAPEHPFPAALDDCMSTLHWMHSQAVDLGLDPNRIAVGGASAGGGLAAAVAERAHDEGLQLRAQALIYPMLDDRPALRDDHGGRGRFMWTPAADIFGWTSYLGHTPRMSDAPAYAAPARRIDLSGVAPAWIGVGDLDMLFEEDVAYAQRLQAGGVACELVTVAGMYHAADGIKPKAPAMKDFHGKLEAFLRTALAD